MPFPRISVQIDMPTALSTIWTRVILSISENVKHYSKHASVATLIICVITKLNLVNNHKHTQVCKYFKRYSPNMSAIKNIKCNALSNCHK